MEVFSAELFDEEEKYTSSTTAVEVSALIHRSI